MDPSESVNVCFDFHSLDEFAASHLKRQLQLFEANQLSMLDLHLAVKIQIQHGTWKKDNMEPEPTLINEHQDLQRGDLPNLQNLRKVQFSFQILPDRIGIFGFQSHLKRIGM